MTAWFDSLATVRAEVPSLPPMPMPSIAPINSCEQMELFAA